MEQTDEFYAIAAYAGQDRDKLRSGETVVTYFRIGTMEEARQILSRATEEERKKRGLTFFDGLEYRSRIPQGMHDRGEAYVFADHALEAEKDSRGHHNHLPIYVRMLSVPEKTVAPNEVWDVTLSPSEWSADPLEEMYNIVNVGRLILEKNASVVARGNAFCFTCQELVKTDTSEQAYDIGILATPHGFGLRSGALDGRDGDCGTNGRSGAPGVEPSLGANFLGKVIQGDFSPDRMDGRPGTQGEDGQDGEDGLNGGACRIAELNIRSLQTPGILTIGAIAGDGGNGGNGGHGGAGGHGGDGAAAVKTVTGLVGPGKAGIGGVGGRGGKGGRAGHSGISSNVFIHVPDQSADQVVAFSRPGRPGIPGKGGLGGSEGKGGLIRQAGLDGSVNGYDGTPGKDGPDGREGRSMPKANIYLNGTIVDR